VRIAAGTLVGGRVASRDLLLSANHGVLLDDDSRLVPAYFAPGARRLTRDEWGGGTSATCTCGCRRRATCCSRTASHASRCETPPRTNGSRGRSADDEVVEPPHAKEVPLQLACVARGPCEATAPLQSTRLCSGHFAVPSICARRRRRSRIHATSAGRVIQVVGEGRDPTIGNYRLPLPPRIAPGSLQCDAV
jgi:hypothetical protein